MSLEDGLMPAADFVAWMDLQSLNDTTAARQLGVSRPSVIKYRKEGAPRVVALACAAISADLEPSDALRPVAWHAPETGIKLGGFAGSAVGGVGPGPGGPGGPGYTETPEGGPGGEARPRRTPQQSKTNQ